MSKSTRPSSWFVFATLAILGLLTFGITTAYLLLLRQSSQLRVGLLTGSSMEPTLRGPRIEMVCEKCQSKNSWTCDAWNPQQEARCQHCDEYLTTANSAYVEGEAIVYVPSILWDKRQKAQGKEPTGLAPIQRWDIAVLETIDADPRLRGQIKRVVGLPGETLAIRNGRIWVDEHPVVPTPTEFMQQAVLVSSWPGTFKQESLDKFISQSPFPIDNQLSINAHDSHQRIPVQDIGIAFRLGKPQSQWNLKLTLRHGLSLLPIELSCYENSAQISVQKSWVTLPNWKPIWINLVVLNNRLWILDEKQPKGSIDLEPLEDGLGWGDLRLVEPDGLVDRCMIYRGLHFRGAYDSNEQNFQADQGWIVLGDNVSISEDSRNWQQERVELAKIRGLLNDRSTLMEGLVRQEP